MLLWGGGVLMCCSGGLELCCTGPPPRSPHSQHQWFILNDDSNANSNQGNLRWKKGGRGGKQGWRPGISLASSKVKDSFGWNIYSPDAGLRQARGSLGEALQKTRQTTIGASAWCWDSSVPTFVSAVATHLGRDRNPASRAQIPGEIIHSQPMTNERRGWWCATNQAWDCGARQSVQWWRGGRGGGEISASLGVTSLHCTVTYLHHHTPSNPLCRNAPASCFPPRAPQAAQLEKTFHE